MEYNSSHCGHSVIEELLIDFKGIIGEHSGKNLAEVVWTTLERYKITNKVSLHHGIYISFGFSIGCFKVGNYCKHCHWMDGSR